MRGGVGGGVGGGWSIVFLNSSLQKRMGSGVEKPFYLYISTSHLIFIIFDEVSSSFLEYRFSKLFFRKEDGDETSCWRNLELEARRW